MTIPYFTFWSFGERLPVVEEESRDADSIVYSFQTISALLANRLQHVEQLVVQRDAYVRSVEVDNSESLVKYDVFFSYDRTSRGSLWIAQDLAKTLRKNGVSVAFNEEFAGTSLDLSKHLEVSLRNSFLFAPIIEGSMTRWQNEELSRFIVSDSLDRETEVVPIFFGDPNWNSLPKMIASRNGIQLKATLGESFDELANQIINIVKAQKEPIKHEENMSKKKIFISFDYDNDKHYKNLLVAWDKNDLFDFVFHDESVSVAVNSNDASYIRSVIKKKIENADILLCIVGEKTHESSWCSWEIETAKGLAKSLIGVKTNSTNTSPSELLDSGATWAMSFTFDAIKQTI